MRTVNEYHEKVRYIHENPVKAGLVKRPEEWAWSSVHDYLGHVNFGAGTARILVIDRVVLPLDGQARI